MIIRLEPLNGIFDIEKIKKYIETFPFTFQDPIDSHVYLLCRNKVSEEYCRQERMNSKPYPYVGLVYLQPNLISINHLCGEEEFAQCRKFVEWIVKQYSCKITDDYGNDWTEQCKENVDVLYKG